MTDVVDWEMGRWPPPSGPPQAIAYRRRQGLSDPEVAAAVVILEIGRRRLGREAQRARGTPGAKERVGPRETRLTAPYGRRTHFSQNRGKVRVAAG